MIDYILALNENPHTVQASEDRAVADSRLARAQRLENQDQPIEQALKNYLISTSSTP